MATHIFKALPGIEMSLSEVNDALDHMWDGASVDGSNDMGEFHAIQLNLVLHFGVNADRAEACARFDTAIHFAQRYPSRIIVLCPLTDNSDEELLRAKLFSQCYIGHTQREMCCCEAVILGYDPNESSFLEHQLSLFWEPDLPVYHWFDGVPAETVKERYLKLVRRTHRVLYDMSKEGEAYTRINWPPRVELRELGAARGLTVRQSLGQFLSAFEPRKLVEDLRTVIVRAGSGFLGEAHSLADWQRACIQDCGRRAGCDVSEVRYVVEPLEDFSPYSLQTLWSFRNTRKTMRWSRHSSSATGSVRADLGDGRVAHPIQVRRLTDEVALAEALFF